MIIDELGRGTSTKDGISISWSICEYLLLNYQSFIFFVTHFIELTQLENYYPNVKNYHLLVDCTTNTLSSNVTSNSELIQFKFQVTEGSVKQQTYGLHLAQRAGMLQSVIENSRKIRVYLEGKIHEKSNMKEEISFLYYKLAQRLLSLKHSR